jgi:hypothetical protein
MRSMRAWVLLGMVLGSGACGNLAPGFGNPSVSRRGGGCDGAEDGVLVLAWTIRGAAPAAASCSGIDHLEVDLASAACDVSIEPVPCALAHWRYDHLPDGDDQITVNAFDAQGNVTASGAVEVSLSSAVPSPAPVDLR